MCHSPCPAPRSLRVSSSQDPAKSGSLLQTYRQTYLSMRADSLTSHLPSHQAITFQLALYFYNVFLWEAGEVLGECAVRDRAWPCPGPQCLPRSGSGKWLSLPPAQVQMLTNVSVCRKLQLQLPLPRSLQPETAPLQRPPTDTCGGGVSPVLH